MSGSIEMNEASEIAEFFTGRSVFLTGMTGFLGKVLLEKVLRSCPDVGNVFVLIREKKGQKCRDRLNKLLKAALFEPLMKQRPEVFEKIQVMVGDLTQPDLGMSDSDRERIAKEVSVVIHGAASVRFEEPLRLSIRSNISATKMVLDLCRDIKDLKVYVHISTAYCNCNEKEIQEKVYQTQMKPSNLMHIADWMDDALLEESLKPKLTEGRPNVYTYTKAVAEELVLEAANTMPVAIVRPSIITASWKEPFEGWVDNLNGPTGLFAAIWKGILTSMYTNFKCATDLIPVDMVSNSILAAAWYRGSGRTEKLEVYNMTSGAENRLTWKELIDHIADVPHTFPSRVILRYPQPRCTNSKLVHRLRMFFEHYLLAQAGDFALRAVGRKPWLSQMYDRLKTATEIFEHFTGTEWYFHNENVRSLYSELNSKDKEEFNFDVKCIVWKDYLRSYCLGIRQYILKEDLSTVPEGQRSLSRMYAIGQAGNLLLAVGVWRFLKAVAFDPVDVIYGAGSYLQELVDLA